MSPLTSATFRPCDLGLAVLSESQLLICKVEMDEYQLGMVASTPELKWKDGLIPKIS